MGTDHHQDKSDTKARYYSIEDSGKLRCTLCPHYCILEDGARGRCRVRRNASGLMQAESWAKVSGYHMDPIEKKPLYQFYPGSQILSVGSYGCNFRCPWCQNAAISQCGVDEQVARKEIRPEEVVDTAAQSHSIGVAYTYNEPTVWFEFMMDVARPVYERDMKNVVVTNGFINPEPLSELLEVSHAFNVDLKSFDDEVYRNSARGRLEPVLYTIKAIAAAGKHLEITFLVVPGVNDDLELFDEMTPWIAKNAGKNTVLHINRYYPSWKTQTPPTSISLMRAMKRMATAHLPHVYLGNVPGA